VSSVIAQFTALLLLPLNTRLFTETEYGAIATIDATVRLVAIGISLYLDSAFIRFYHELNDEVESVRRLTSTLYWFVLIWGSVTVVISLLVVSSLTVVEVPAWPVLVLAFLAALLVRLATFGTAFLSQNHRSTGVVSINILNLVVQVVLLLLLSGALGFGLTGKYVGVFAGALLALVLSTAILLKEGLLGLRFSRSMLKASLVFSVPLIPNVAAGWITGFSDRIILSWYGTLADTGVYSVGYSVARGVTVFSEAIFMVYGPWMFAMLTKDTDIGKIRIERFVPYFFMFMTWIGLAIFLYAKEIISILAPDEYADAVLVIPIVLLAYVLASQYKPFVNILSFQKLTLIISIGAIMQACVNLIANIILIPRFGQLAAAWTTLLAVVSYTIWLIVWSQRTMYLKLDYRSMLTTGVIGLIIATLGLRIEVLEIDPVLLIPVKSLLLGVALILFWITGAIKISEKRRILALVRL
jgi:O-antigen/teichoic acid export membrane protein